MCLSNAHQGTVARYEQLLKAHDWYYDYVDSLELWQNGFRESAELKALFNQIEPEIAKELWNKHAPEPYRIKPRGTTI